MFTHFDVIAALAGVKPGLLLHAVVVGVDLALVDREAGAATGADDGDADAGADVLLLGLVLIGVLQAAQGEVAADLGGDLLATDLGTDEAGIAAADEGDLAAGIDGGFSPGGTVAVFEAGALVAVGKDAQATTTAAEAQKKGDRSIFFTLILTRQTVLE